MFLWSSFTLNLPHLPPLETQAASEEKQTNKTNHSSLSGSILGEAHRVFSLVCRLLARVWLFLPGLELGCIFSSWHTTQPDALQLTKTKVIPACRVIGFAHFRACILEFCLCSVIESLLCSVLIPVNFNVMPLSFSPVPYEAPDTSLSCFQALFWPHLISLPLFQRSSLLFLSAAEELCAIEGIKHQSHRLG